MKIAYLPFGTDIMDINRVCIHDQRLLSKMVEYGHKPHLIAYFGGHVVDVKGVTVHKYDGKWPYGKWPYGLARYIGFFLGYEIIKRMFAFRAGYHLKKLLKTIKPDILQTGFIQYNGFCGALAGFKPTISAPAGSDVLINPDESFFDKLITKYTLRKADMVQCDSNVVKEKIMEIAEIPERKINVFPQIGIDLNKFKPKDKDNRIISQLGLDGKPILIMTRAFRPVYGIEYFLEALAKIVKEVDFRVIMCGDGPLREKFESFIRNNGIAKNVRLMGSVNNEELPHYLNVADIYVSTSLSDGTSLSLLESMACGLPVVISDVPSNLEWIQDDYNGFVVPRKDSQILGKKIISLLKNRELRQKFGERNLRIAKERADINKNFEKLEAVYKRLVVMNDDKIIEKELK